MMSLSTTSPARPPQAEPVALVTEITQLESLRPAWDDLLRRSGADEPMLAPLWLLTWWRVYGQGTRRKLRIGLFYREGRLVGLAPLLQRRYTYLPGIPFRRLEPLGAGEDDGDGVCSDYLNIIAERGAEDYVAGELARALTAGLFGSWDELVLPMMNGDGPLPALLLEALGAAGLAAACRVTSSAPYISLPATWDAYVQLLSGSQRRFLLRSVRDFESWAGAGLEIHRANSASDLDKGKRVLIDLHAERWAGAGRPGGVFGATRFRAFHDEVLPRLLASDSLELLWLTVRGQPVAAVYNIVWAGKVYFYQSGRATELPNHIRPGIAIHAYAIRAAIEAGRREYDFLAGAARYKLQLAPSARQLVEVRATRPSFRELVRLAADYGICTARRVHDRARLLLGSWRRAKSPEGADSSAPAGAAGDFGG